MFYPSARAASLAALPLAALLVLTGCRAPWAQEQTPAPVAETPQYLPEYPVPADPGGQPSTNGSADTRQGDSGGTATTPRGGDTTSRVDVPPYRPGQTGTSTESEYYGEDQHYAKCERVGWVGDSLSVGSWGEGIIKHGDRMMEAVPEVMARAGVRFLITDSSGGRSIHERVGIRQPNGIEAINALPEVDCLIAALGTNDAANVVVGSQMSAGERISAVNDAAGDIPVFWFPVVIDPSATATGYRPEGAATFNSALTAANANIIDWDPAPGDFTDGIHLTPAAYEDRITAAAAALAAYDRQR